jgi:hypothetical protein
MRIKGQSHKIFILVFYFTMQFCLAIHLFLLLMTFHVKLQGILYGMEWKHVRPGWPVYSDSHLSPIICVVMFMCKYHNLKNCI